MVLLAALLLGGCSSPEWKGSPLYTGEYEVNVPDADRHRVNLWPLVYYREPALSLLWPVFERTEEHVAVRPLFSAYGDTDSYWKYSVLWPLGRFDTKSDDYYLFPYYWGSFPQEGSAGQRYHVLFPFVWHYADETCSLFPLWIYDRDRGKGPAVDRDFWLLPPALRYRASPSLREWHATLFWHYEDRKGNTSHAGFPWPLLFSWRDRYVHGLFTPLYAFEESDTPGVKDGWDAIPLLLSWRHRQTDGEDLTAGLGIYRRSRHGGDSSGWLLPLCGYDTRDKLFMTPLFGWDKPDDQDPNGFWYPVTPLAGKRTGNRRGSWLFPLFSYTADVSGDNCEAWLLGLGYAGKWHRDGADGSTDRRYGCLFPLISHSVYATTRKSPSEPVRVDSVTRFDRQLLCWQSMNENTRRSPGDPSNTRDNRKSTVTEQGLFPLWSTGSSAETLLDGSPLSRTDESAVLLALYDTRHDVAAATGKAPATDYTRRRVLWRLWHYERRNGDVSADLFPFITYDARADGFRKTSFLWRFFRYERSPDGKAACDLIFLPVWRE